MRMIPRGGRLGDDDYIFSTNDVCITTKAVKLEELSYGKIKFDPPPEPKTRVEKKVEVKNEAAIKEILSITDIISILVTEAEQTMASESMDDNLNLYKIKEQAKRLVAEAQKLK